MAEFRRLGVGESTDEIVDDGGEWWLSELMKVIRQLLIAWMLVAFLALHGFGKDAKPPHPPRVPPHIDWTVFTYNSPEEKEFWDKLPDWSDKILVRGWGSKWWLPQPDRVGRRNTQGNTIESNSSEGFNGYVKYFHFYINQRSVLQFVDGYAVRAKSWFQSGQKESETNFKEGEMHGLGTSWYENGQKKWERNFKDGKKDGLETKWYENGKKWSKTNYNNGILDGLRTVWYENGKKWSKTNFKEGRFVGLFTTWYENGQISEERNYSEEKNYKNWSSAEGLWTNWYENGQKSSESNHKDGKLIHVKVWLPDGKECPESKVIDGNGTLVTYSLEGKEISRRNIRAGRMGVPLRGRTITIPPRNPFLRPGSTRPSNSPKPTPPSLPPWLVPAAPK